MNKNRTMNLRKIIFALFYWTGIMRAWMYFNRNKIAILMLHQIMEEDGLQTYVPLRRWGCITTDQLNKYLEIIAKYYNVISLREAEQILAGMAKAKPYSIVLTFDDGFRNNLTHAAPLLAKYNFPMTIFLTTSLIDSRKPLWVDRLDYAFLHAVKEEYAVVIEGRKLVLSGKTRAEKTLSLRKFIKAAKAVPCNDLDFTKAIDNITIAIEVA